MVDTVGHITWTEDRRSPHLLLPMVYEELRRIARAYLRRENGSRLLDPTELVHEAYLRLESRRPFPWQGRTHFLAIAAGEMRRVLVERARAAKTRKRGDGFRRITLSARLPRHADGTVEILALEEALTHLEERSPRQARVAQMRLFAGMHVREIGEHLGVSERTVKGDWRMARAWLARELRSGGGA